MFVKVDKTNYFVNTDGYNGNEVSITNEIVEEIISRMDVKFLSNTEKEKLKIKIYNRYQEAKNKNLPFY
jgi:hypothetical protein